MNEKQKLCSNYNIQQIESLIKIFLNLQNISLSLMNKIKKFLKRCQNSTSVIT